MLMVGDGAAALVGRRYGRHRYPFVLAASKSLEGSAAFLLTALLTALPLALAAPPGHPPLTPAQLGLGALTATLAEALDLPANDNVRVPLVAGLVMTLMA
jgi:dolichol kinase